MDVPGFQPLLFIEVHGAVIAAPYVQRHRAAANSPGVGHGVVVQRLPHVLATAGFVNALRPGTITVKKVDTTGSPLAGATFLLEWSEDGNTWQSVQYSEFVTKGGCSAKDLTDGCLTSGEDGILQWTGLHPGLHYRLTETKAPDGFKLLTETAFTGTIPTDTLSVELTVVNARTFTMPETGVVSGAILRVLGLAAAIGCLCMLSVLSRKRH